METDACPAETTHSIASSRSSSTSSAFDVEIFPFSILSITSPEYSTSSACDLTNSIMLCTSSSETKQPCTLTGLPIPSGLNNISPLPTSFSAPDISKIVLESNWDDTAKAILEGILALITPVIISTEGLCVATIKCMPAALAICARRQIESSTCEGAAIIRSASSSIMITT